MLSSLELKNVGPAPNLSMQLGSRLNVITGDNGLGKSFLLDVSWWALTRHWLRDVNPSLSSGYVPRPTVKTEQASIAAAVELATGHLGSSTSTYQSQRQAWMVSQGDWLSGSDAIVLYALGDGGVAVWDPARNETAAPVANLASRRPALELPHLSERMPAYVFTADAIWDGLRASLGEKSVVVCNGLLADWASWIRERGADAERMAAVLSQLAPIFSTSSLEVSSSFARLSLGDARDIPQIQMGYGQSVPILYASLGVRRIIALAYAITWAWREHLVAVRELGAKPASQMVLIFDELEAHLHPRWQRAIAPALLNLSKTLTGGSSLRIQLIATTHSPLVLASLEPLFNEETDRLFTLEQREAKKGASGEVSLHQQPWAKQGDVVNWLVSDSFGLKQGRSLEAERAIEAAEAWMRSEKKALPAALNTREKIDAELRRTLAGHDDFWPRWIVDGGGLSPKPPAKRTARRAPVKKRVVPAVQKKTRRPSAARISRKR